MSSIKFQPGQILRTRGSASEWVWFQIEGVHLGSVRETDVLTIVPLSLKPGHVGGATLPEMTVPEDMIAAAIRSGAAWLYTPSVPDSGRVEFVVAAQSGRLGQSGTMTADVIDGQCDFNAKASRSEAFRSVIETTINRFSRESESDTPDFVLADYLVASLEAFERSTLSRERHYGRVGRAVLRDSCVPPPPPTGAPYSDPNVRDKIVASVMDQRNEFAANVAAVERASREASGDGCDAQAEQLVAEQPETIESLRSDRAYLNKSCAEFLAKLEAARLERAALHTQRDQLWDGAKRDAYEVKLLGEELEKAQASKKRSLDTIQAALDLLGHPKGCLHDLLVPAVSKLRDDRDAWESRARAAMGEKVALEQALIEKDRCPLILSSPTTNYPPPRQCVFRDGHTGSCSFLNAVPLKGVVMAYVAGSGATK